MVAHTCNSRAWEIEAGGSEIQGHLQLHTQFKACLGCDSLDVIHLVFIIIIKIVIDFVCVYLSIHKRWWLRGDILSPDCMCVCGGALLSFFPHWYT